MNFHFYACQVYFSFDSVSSFNIPRIEACLQDIATCMSLNKLKLNGDKAVSFWSLHRTMSASQLSSFNAIDGSAIELSHSAKNIVVIFHNN